MKLQFHKKSFQIKNPMDIPSWAEKVPRWYQLDGFALALTDLMAEKKLDFDHMILISPKASNYTDLDFIQTGAHKAQKFVHTLPNIRASMALQALEKVCPFICIIGSSTEGLEEFQALRKDGKRPLLACVEGPNLDASAEKLQTYTAWILAPDGPDRWKEIETHDAF